MLQFSFQQKFIEAGCDEAGRGCLAGPVFAAAVILPEGFSHPVLNDSKKLSKKQRDDLRKLIEDKALAFSVQSISNTEIDEINILNASFKAMHLALDSLQIAFGFIAVDGNRFPAFHNIPHKTIVQGDGKYMNIAAASILAKTYRDAFMEKIHEEYPAYGWLQNKGYGTAEHRKAILELGQSPYHRKSFVLKETQFQLFGQ